MMQGLKKTIFYPYNIFEKKNIISESSEKTARGGATIYTIYFLIGEKWGSL